MKKVFIDHLPKRKNGKSLKIDWNKTIGHKIYFVYEDIQGEFEIINYDSKKSKLLLLYQEEIHAIIPGNLQKNKLGGILGLIKKEHEYEVGTVLNDMNNGKLELVKQIRIKRKKERRGYIYKCLICGNQEEISESNIKMKRGCNVCAGRKALKGYNDIHTTNKYLGSLLWNFEDGFKYCEQSNQSIDFKCPDCNYRMENTRISLVCNYGLACPKCSDGFSIPEKFMFNLLDYLQVDFDYQKVFDWSLGKRYDFYIPMLNCIIETHGAQHYQYSGFMNSLEQEQKNDSLKERLARENGINNYLIIDCRKSELEFMKQSILKSNLLVKLNKNKLNELEWLELFRKSMRSKVKEACLLRKEGKYSSLEISKMMKLNRYTVISYLKQGDLLGWCVYDPRKEITKGNEFLYTKVVQLSKLNEVIAIWDDAYHAARTLKLKSYSILQACKGNSITVGGYKWEFYKENSTNKKIKTVH